MNDMKLFMKAYILGDGGLPESKATESLEWLDSDEAIRSAVDAVPAPGKSAWVARDEKSAETLVRAAVAKSMRRRSRADRRLGKLVFLGKPRRGLFNPALSLFNSVAVAERWLSLPEMVEILGSRDRRKYVIGGAVDQGTETLTIVRGDLTQLTVPLSVFRPSGTTKPDFRRFDVIDFGQTIRLGEYEADTDAVLYEADPEYRKRERNRRRESDNTFGASLRRLRLLRNMSQGDFTPLPSKTIARIENGEVGQPRGRTLRTIAGHLHIAPEEIASY
jgi:hypothetical protein